MSDSTDLYYAHEYLENKFESGEFSSTINHLFDYLDQHLDEIRTMVPDYKSADDTLVMHAVNTLIRERRVIHLPSEMADQIKEISKEVWIRGEEGNTDIPRIKENWAQKHAKSWRQARIIENLFLANKMQQQVLELIRN